MQTPPASPQYAYAPSLGSTTNVPQVAQDLQSQGRGDDSMLIHMTPKEVGGLQALAQNFGGSLTINPNTGLPEAGFLSGILPVLAGIGLSFIPGVNALAAGAIAGAGTTAVTGDLQKGLLAGLGAFGGASLGSALAGSGATAGAIAPGVTETATSALPGSIATPLSATPLGAAAGVMPTTETIASQLGNVAGSVATPAFNVGTGAINLGSGTGASLLSGSTGGLGSIGGSATNLFGTAGTTMAPSAAGEMVRSFAPQLASTGAAGAPAGFLSRFGSAASEGLGTGIAAKAAPYAAGLGLLTPGMQPPKFEAPKEEESNYRGPYRMVPRRVVYPGAERGAKDSSEFNYFPDRVQLVDASGQPYAPGQRYAEGGQVGGKGGTQSNAPVASANPENYAAPDNSILSAAPTQTATPSYATPITGGGMQTGIGNLGGDAAPIPRTTAGKGGTTTNAPVPTVSPQNYAVATPTTFAPMGGEQRYDFGRQAAPSALYSGSPTSSGPWQYAGSSAGKGGRLANSSKFQNKVQGKLNELNQQSMYTQPQFQQPAVNPRSYTLQRAAPVTRSAEQMYTFNRPADIPSLYSRQNDISDYMGLGGLGGYYAKGGKVPLEDGSFIVDARTVSEIGNGSSNAGIERLGKLGGEPIHGPGDGVSDSVPANIGGEQEARVARDEVKFNPEAIKRLGGGDHKKGVKKLYAMMNNAEKARKKAKRGQDTGGLAGIMAKA